MNGKRLRYILAIICGLMISVRVYATGAYDGGDGSAEHPFEIANVTQLLELGQHSEDWGLCFILTSNINLSGHTFTKAVIAPDTFFNGLYPYEFDGPSFTGVFDGNNYVISNLAINNNYYLGLFGQVENGTIKNLGLNNANIQGLSILGGIVASSKSSIISNCFVTGSISGGSSLGGICGRNEHGIIRNCSSSITISGYGYLGGLVGGSYNSTISNCYAMGNIIISVSEFEPEYFGGLVGGSYNSTISNCYAMGNIISVSEFEPEYFGGLVGYNYSGSIHNSYATGSISVGIADRHISFGGLVGKNENGNISNCYATGNVSGGDGSWFFGGLVGYNLTGNIINCYATGVVEVGDSSMMFSGLVGANEGSTISNCYSTGSVLYGNDPTDFGGLVGYSSNIISGGYYLITAGPDNGLGEPLSDAQMRQQSNFIGWDFVGESSNGTNEIWQMPNGGGYPVQSNFNGYIPPILTGAGTPENPYLISDPNELGAIYHYDNTACFRLIEDIDLSGINWSSAPLLEFSGCFEGNRHSISHLSVTGIRNLGLIGFAAKAQIANLGLEDLNISGIDNIGGLAGSNNNSRISECYTTGRVSGDDSLGGLVGRNTGYISDSYSTVSVNGGYYSYYLGGLVGRNYDNISDCYATGSVSSGTYSKYLGGLVGYNNLGSISNCYATGSVSSGDNSDYLGGLVGSNNASIGICYFLHPDDGGGPINGLGTPLSDAQMKQQNSFVGWDFDGFCIWSICNGTTYPRLAWQVIPGDFVCPYGVDLQDFNILAQEWQKEGTNLDSDIYPAGGDRIVDVYDLFLLCQNWLKVTDGIYPPASNVSWSHPSLLIPWHSEVQAIVMPYVTADKLTMFYSRYNDLHGHREIIEATRTEPRGEFTTTKYFPELNGGIAPWLSTDRLRMYYNEIVGGIYIIKLAERVDLNSPWIFVRTISEIQEPGYTDYRPTLTADELTIIWTSYRPAGSGIVSSIWMATRNSTAEPFSNVTHVTEFDIGTNNSAPCILPDGLTIYFQGSSTGHPWMFYKATRKSLLDPFSKIKQVTMLDGTSFDGHTLFVTPDEKDLYFYSQWMGQGEGIHVSYYD